KKYAAQIFDALKSPVNHGYLILFSETARKSPEVSSKESLSGLLSLMQAHGSTALFDAAAQSVTLLQASQARKMLFIISDGDDNASKTQLRDVLDKALQSKVQIFCFGVMSRETL